MTRSFASANLESVPVFPMAGSSGFASRLGEITDRNRELMTSLAGKSLSGKGERATYEILGELHGSSGQPASAPGTNWDGLGRSLGSLAGELFKPKVQAPTGLSASLGDMTYYGRSAGLL